MDVLRFAFIVPEWMMFAALLLVSVTYAVRLIVGIRPSARDGQIAMTVIAMMSMVQAVLYLLIWISGNRTGLNWLIRLNLLIFALALAVHSAIIIWQHGRNRNRHDRNIDRSDDRLNNLKPLADALIGAFDAASFDRMLRQFGKSREEITTANGLRNVVWDVLEAAERENWLGELKRSALAANPTNQRLLKVQ